LLFRTPSRATPYSATNETPASPASGDGGSSSAAPFREFKFGYTIHSHPKSPGLFLTHRWYLHVNPEGQSSTQTEMSVHPCASGHPLECGLAWSKGVNCLPAIIVMLLTAMSGSSVTAHNTKISVANNNPFGCAYRSGSSRGRGR